MMGIPKGSPRLRREIMGRGGRARQSRPALPLAAFRACWYGTRMPWAGPAEARQDEVHASQVEDSRLVSAVVRGDRAALASLYDRHAPVLLAVAVRILGDRALAEDVLHDVFLEAWHHAPQYDGARGSVRAWLVTRMRSRALDRRTKNQRGAKLIDSAGHEVDARLLPPAGDHADHASTRRMVAALADDLARVVHLAYFEGLSSSEIAARIGIPVGTVKSRMARAVAALRQRMGIGGDEGGRA